ncbi:MAG TPA: O-antigen ligase family protein [Vicinamibacteria bacterium]|nr:O-antigen ligase family protein [Vicinamibacteria bacterium]
MQSHALASPRPVAPAPGARLLRPPAPAGQPDRRWDALLVCVAGYLLTSVGRVHQLFPVLEAVRPAMLTGLLAIAMYSIDRREDRRLERVWVPATRWLLALVLWMVLSVPGALVIGASFELVFGNFVKTALMCVVVAGSVRGLRDVERLAAAYLLGAGLYAGVVVLRFDLGGGESWRLGRLYYYDANDLATFLVTALPFGLYFLHTARRAWGRLLAAAALTVLALALVYTGSRGGFVALVAATAFILLRYSAIPLRHRLLATALVAAVMVGAASGRYWEQMSTIVSDADYNRTAESGRMQIWRRGVGYMLRHPVLGVGPRNFQTAEGTLSPFADRQQFGIGVRWNAAHNTYIQAGAELGIPGLVMFAAVILSTLAALRRCQASEPGPGGRKGGRTRMAQVLTASLIGFAVGAFFLSLAYSEMLYTLVGLAVGLQKLQGGRA